MDGIGALPPWLVVVLAIITVLGGGGLGGLVVQWVKDRREAQTGERSVAIVEIEKAVPGLGEIISQLRQQNTAQATRIDEQQLEIGRLRRRVEGLEQELAAAERRHA